MIKKSQLALTSGGRRVADIDEMDPGHPEALKRALHSVVGNPMQLMPFRAGNSHFVLTFSQEQRNNLSTQQPVRGMLWRVRQGSTGQLVGMLDVSLQIADGARLLDVTVDLPHQAALIPSVSPGERLTKAEQLEFDEYKDFVHEHDASLRRSIAQRTNEWRQLVSATRCVVRSDDVYLPHYLREIGYDFVFDTATPADSGRVPFVAVMSTWSSGNGLPSMDRALKSAFIRQETLRLVHDPDTTIRTPSFRSWLRGRTTQSLIGFETRHMVRDSQVAKSVQWYVPDRRDQVAPGFIHATSADLVVKAVRAVDRAGRLLGVDAMPSTVVFARPRTVATDVLSLNWDAAYGRNDADGKLSLHRPRTFVIDERMVRLPAALQTHRRFAHEVRDGVRLPSAVLPVEETIAALAWRQMLSIDRMLTALHRQRLRAAVEALIGGRGIELLDRPFDVNETLRDVQHRAAMVNEIGSHRALRSVDAFGTQMFANWFNNPLATAQADHVMSAMQLDQHRPELTL